MGSLKAEMKLLIFLLFFLLLASISMAEDCDYYDYENYTEEATRFYLGEELLEGTIEIEDTEISGETVRFKIYNPFDFDVNLTINYVLASHWFGNRPHSVSGTIPSKEYVTLKGYYRDSHTSLTDVELQFASPPDFKKKIEKVNKQKPICKCNSRRIYCETSEKCVSKRDVPDDVRPSCGLREECESEFIDSETGLCAKSPSQIEEEEEERRENELRVKEIEARKLELEAKEREQQAEREKQEAERRAQEARKLELEARERERESERQKLEAQMMEQEAQRQHEQRKFITYSLIAVIVLLAVLIIGGGIFLLFFKVRLHEAKQKTLEKEIELEARHIESREYKLEELKKKIKEIQKNKKLKEKEQRELEDLKSEAEKLNSYIENQWKKTARPFPYEGANNRLVIINPHLGGYMCFYDENLSLDEYRAGSLVHRWMWKKHHGRWPKQGWHIHHVDGNKYNNRIENLKEIEGEQHYALHGIKYPK